jgi:uncharacterized membrane-anchored protein YjiN (DUF445 family)
MSSLAAPIPSLPSTDEIQVRRTLRRNRLLAAGLLLLMVLIAIATHFAAPQGWVIQLIRAGAEAGIVGGLADWFAVTVLFRHPLGIPIPHTAILPRNKDRIGRSLGSFVERNFLVPEVILPKLRQADLTGKIAGWLASPENTPKIAEWIITILQRLIAGGGIAQINEIIQHTIRQQQRLDLAPLLARVIDVATTSEESNVLFEKVAQTAESWITTHRSQIDEMVKQQSHWFIPRMIDRRIAASLVDSAIDLLRQLRQRDSEVRKQLRDEVAKLTNDLTSSVEQRDKIQRLKDRLLSDTEVRAWLARAWDDLAQRLTKELSDPRSNVRSNLRYGILSLAHSVREDPLIRTSIEAAIEALMMQLVQWRGEIGSLIAEVVKSWDARTVSDRLELVLGSDLQYIRMNGTIVGALVGCTIFLVSDVSWYESWVRYWFR